MGCAGCIGPRHLFGSYHGTVVDEATGNPIEGAVVVVWWERCFVYEMNGCGVPHSVREAVTGSSGEFSIPARRDLDWNPLSYVGHRWARITVYAVDYLPLSTVHRTVPGFEGDASAFDEAIMRGEDIPLRRPADPEELGKYAGMSVSGTSMMPESLIPELFSALDRQREKLGAGPIGSEYWKRRREREKTH